MPIVGIDGNPISGGEDQFIPWTLAEAIEATMPATGADAMIMITLHAKTGFRVAAKFPPALNKHQVLELTQRIQKITKAWLVETGMVYEPETEAEDDDDPSIRPTHK